jgi:hypothetical protein
MAVRCAHVEHFSRIAQLDSDGPVELKVIGCQLLNDEKDLLANDKAGISLSSRWASRRKNTAKS